MSTRRVRPRYGRLAAAGASLVITLVTLLGGVGVLGDGASAAADAGTDADTTVEPAAALAAVTSPTPTGGPVATGDTATSEKVVPKGSAPQPTALPTDSGAGKRVVFDMSDQRVWLVSARGDRVLRTYLVSGSLTDNLDPGTYAVYSRSRWAVGIDDSGVMQFFTRFTRGDNAAIGFHSIPTKDGRALQTAAQLGTPQSHGCIRQAMPDAKALWEFAPEGTKVVVTA